MEMTDFEMKEMIESKENTRLINKLAKRYSWNKALYQELLMEGKIAIWEVAQKYEGDRGVKFTTYAYRFVQGRITAAAAKMSGAISVSRNKYREACSIKRKMNSGSEDANSTKGKWSSFAATQAISLMSLESSNLSVTDAEGKERRLEEVLADKGTKTPLEILIEREMHRNLKKALRELSDRERRVLFQAFGLNGCQKKSLTDIAHSEGVSVARCSQIKEGAIIGLRRYMMCA